MSPRGTCRFSLAATLTMLLLLAGLACSAQPPSEPLTSLWNRISLFQQGWGEPGAGVSAHAPGQTPLPMQIKDRHFAEGLGTHAPGRLVLDLEGQYLLFTAQVGVQWQQGNTGSVIFRVLVDGKKRFDSGIRRERDAPLPVRVSLRGAQRLELVVTDAGDGMACDCADWAEARLVRDPAAPARPPARSLDIAPFATVITGDPARTVGMRAGRVDEVPPDDLGLDIPVRCHPKGGYQPAVYGDRACLGLLWRERRRLREVVAICAEPVPDPAQVRLECWSGQNRWQGEWKTVPTQVSTEGGRLIFRLHWQGSREWSAGTSKVRLILPAPAPRLLLQAYTGTPTREVTLRLESDRPAPITASLRLYNGEFVSPAAGSAGPVPWRTSAPLTVRLQAHRPGTPADRTLLRLDGVGTSFAISLDDLLARKCVYVRDLHVYATLAGGPTLAEYRRRIAGRETVLDRVRRLPEQTWDRALARTHHPIQDNGPMMLSLACDNAKFVAAREGSLQAPNLRVQVRCGDGRYTRVSRRLAGGWLPMPESTLASDAVTYRQTTFVAPCGDQARPLAVVEMEADRPGEVSLGFLDAEGTPLDAQAEPTGEGTLIVTGDRLLALVQGTAATRTQDGVLWLDARVNPRQLLRLCVPGWPATRAEALAVSVGGPGYREACRRYWEALVPPDALVLPDARLADTIRASQVHCLMAARSEADGARVAAWIASAAYGPLESEAHSVIRGMDLWGHRDFAERALDFFIARYRPSGALTTGYTLMGHGWHLWTVGQHVALHGAPARQWFAARAPQVLQACRWVAAQRAKTAALTGSPEQGLMPPGVMADWNNYAPWFCLNGYYQAGLAAVAAGMTDPQSQVPGWKGQGDSLAAEASAFRARILQAYRETRAWTPVVPLQDGTWVPGYPAQSGLPGPTGDFFPGEDANRSWCYDVELGPHHLAAQGLLDPTDRQVSWMLEHMEDVQFLSEGWFDYPAAASRRHWFDLGGFAKVQPYYCRAGQLYAARGEVKPFLRTYFNSLAAMLNTETLWLWEHFHNSGAWNKTHETGYFLEQSRLMLLQERGEELWLAPLVPSAWLGEGKVIAVNNLPSTFGPVSYRIAVKDHEIRATVHAPGAPAVVLRLPPGRPIRRAQANGQAVPFQSRAGLVRFAPRPQGDEVLVAF